MNLTTHMPWCGVCVCVCREGSVLHMCLSYFSLSEKKRQTGEKRDGERARHVAAPSGRLLFLSSCCLRAGGSTAAPCQLLLPQKPPCMQNRHRLPSLLGHAFPPSFFVSVYNKHLLIFSPSLWSRAFIQINFKPSNVVRSIIVATHTNTTCSKWDNFMGKNISRAEKRKCIVLFWGFFQTRLIVYYGVHQFPSCTGKINEHVLIWSASFDHKHLGLLSAVRGQRLTGNSII